MREIEAEPEVDVRGVAVVEEGKRGVDVVEVAVRGSWRERGV